LSFEFCHSTFRHSTKNVAPLKADFVSKFVLAHLISTRSIDSLPFQSIFRIKRQPNGIESNHAISAQNDGASNFVRKPFLPKSSIFTMIFINVCSSCDCTCCLFSNCIVRQKCVYKLKKSFSNKNANNRHF
jgi:hypothetical protein